MFTYNHGTLEVNDIFLFFVFGTAVGCFNVAQWTLHLCHGSVLDASNQAFSFPVLM